MKFLFICFVLHLDMNWLRTDAYPLTLSTGCVNQMRGIRNVRKDGLHRLVEMWWMRIDHALIIGLAERWCPETNMFHFPTREASVTLEDVAYINGLSINGQSVTGRTSPNANVT